MADDTNRLQELVAEVAAAYFSNSHVGLHDIQTVIGQIASSLSAVGARGALPETDASQEEADSDVPAKLTSAQIRRSIRPDALISFEDGRPYKTLRRHLSVKGLTPEQYRQKWGLPADYPMVSPNYSEQRSQMAKSLGLGQRRGGASSDDAPPPAKDEDAATASPPRRRGGRRRAGS